MRNPREVTITALIAFALCFACSTRASIRYPFRTEIAGPPVASLAIEAVNHRPPERGGQGTPIGKLWGTFGNPHPVDEVDASNIARNAADAVIDGLARAGISVDQKSDQKLLVTVNDYWIEGYGGVNASVQLDLTLQDVRGAAVWRESVRSLAGAFGGTYRGANATQQAFTLSLQQIARQCSELFAKDDFRRLLGVPVPPPPPEEAPVGAGDRLRTLARHLGADSGRLGQLLDREGERPGRF